MLSVGGKLHAGAWAVWLVAVAVFAFAVSDPLYITIAIGAVILVHLSLPAADGVAARAVRMFVAFGAVLLVLRLVFVALLPNPGTTALFAVPHLVLPRFLGGLSLGGDIHAEVLAAGFAEGLRLILVLAAFGVFNAHADVSSLLRSVPGAFRDAGLVVSIAFAFVPGMMRTVRDVRDAQRLRGERGLRRLAPSLAVPVLGLSLERALLLAESMDARGYGGASSTTKGRTALVAGLVSLFASVFAWSAGWRIISPALAAIGVAAIVWSLRESAMSSRTTRLARSRLRRFDLVVIFAAGAVVGLVTHLGPDATYNPYPRIVWPGFGIGTAVVAAMLAAPAFASAR